MRGLLTTILGSLILSLVPAAGHAASHCIILQYHHFGTDTPRSTSVTPAEFDAHLDYLARHDYRVMPLEQVVEALRDRRPVPDRCVAISVDDAYTSVGREAWPRLRDRGWPVTVFVNTQALDQGLKGYMDWDTLRQMAAEGVSFQNHSHTHDHLIRHLPGESGRAWRQRVKEDIQTAQNRLHVQLGQAPSLFAYPYGEYDLELKTVVDELKLVGFGQQSGPVGMDSDFLALPRFPMAAGYAAMDGFRTKLGTVPLPVLWADPQEPLLPLDEWRPQLTLTLMPGPWDGLQCYVSGQDRAVLTWLDPAHTRVRVQARAPLAVGRNRYNCTAPTTDGAGYYWYSQPWIRRNADGSWYRE